MLVAQFFTEWAQPRTQMNITVASRTVATVTFPRVANRVGGNVTPARLCYGHRLIINKEKTPRAGELPFISNSIDYGLEFVWNSREWCHNPDLALNRGEVRGVLGGI
jgi:hypothetical protein